MKGSDIFGTLFIIAAVIFFGYVVFKIILADLDKIGNLFIGIIVVFIPLLLIAYFADKNRKKK